jgi:GTPase Era involved in 16S rRNA processing
MRARTTSRASPGYVLGGRNELGQALAVLGEAVAGNALLRERVGSLCYRLEHQRFQLAVLGQFKRGKSTFINALLGAPLLPIAVVPLTAVPVFISWRSHALVQVRFADHRPNEEISTDDPDIVRQFLFRFVSEEGNSKNELAVDRVDLFYPSPILAEGLILIDTPGVGSTFRHNTDAALRVLRECDAAIFVVSVDPPITEVEIEYLRQIEPKAAKLFFVLNKIDYLRPEERDRVGEFVRQALEQHHLWPSDTVLFPLSAGEGLDAKRRVDQAALKSSGVADVEQYLSTKLAAQKARLLEAAIRSKAADIISEAVGELRLQIRVLEMPLHELATKCQTFQQALASIEGQRRVIHDLLDGERRRLRGQLEQRIELLRKNAATKLAEFVDQQPRESEDLKELSQAIGETFDASRQEFSSSFVAIFDSALKDHQKRIGSLVDDVRGTAGTLFNTPFSTRFEPDSFSLGEDPYWVTERIQTTLLPDASGLVDLIMPHPVRLRRRRGRILRQLDELILRNAENLRWAIIRGIDETFRKASFKFEEHLDNAIATTDGIVREAFERRQTNSSAVGGELSRLQKAVGLLSNLQKRFQSEQEDRAREPEDAT